MTNAAISNQENNVHSTGFLPRCFEVFAAWKARRDTLADLRALRATDLKDIGMTANDVDVFARTSASDDANDRQLISSLSRSGNW